VLVLPAAASAHQVSTLLHVVLQAHAERERAGAHKLIERRKLEAKIKDFIRSSISRMHAQRSAGQ
jgi:hypothetical protein